MPVDMNPDMLSRGSVPVEFGTTPADVTKATASAGSAVTAARSDHKHDVTTAAPAAGAVAIGNAAAEGSATSLARSDHTHAVSAAAPVAIGIANAAGSAATFARSDHVHQGQVLQCRETLLGAADATTTNTNSPPTVVLIEDSITTVANSVLYVYAECSVSNTTAGASVRVQVTVDGVAIGGQTYVPPNNNAAGAVVIRRKLTGLSAAAHDVEIRWSASSNTAQCRGAANIYEHATLILEERLV